MILIYYFLSTYTIKYNANKIQLNTKKMKKHVLNFKKSNKSSIFFPNLMLIFLFFSLIFFTNCQQKSETISTNTKCQHCGMPSQKYPKWHTKMIYKNGNIKWTCSPRCMLLLVQNHKTTAQPVQIWVKDYYNLKEIDAKKAFYVVKSDVLGPMGQDFVPLANMADAKNFVKEHKKNQAENQHNILTFSDINMEIIKKALAP